MKKALWLFLLFGLWTYAIISPPFVNACVAGVAPGAPGGCNANEVCTALGCVPTDQTEFVAWVLGWAIRISGGFAFLIMLFGALQIITSSGDPQKIKNGGEMITSALAGLLFLIFSLFLLHLIGVDILKIPGFV